MSIEPHQNISLFQDLAETPVPSPTRVIRRERREIAWRADLTRAWGYWRGRVRSEEEGARIDAVFEAQLAEGPDFARYHRNADFRDAPRITLDGNACVRLMAIYRQIERGTWKRKDKGKHGGVIGKAALRVLEAFLFVLYRPGRSICVPYEAIAMAAMVSRRTVATVLPLLEHMGLLTVHRRIKRIMTPLGIKVVQDVNAYELHEPRGLGAMAVRLFGGLFGSSSQGERSECKNRTAKGTSLHLLEANPKNPAREGPKSHCWRVFGGTAVQT